MMMFWEVSRRIDAGNLYEKNVYLKNVLWHCHMNLWDPVVDNVHA